MVCSTGLLALVVVMAAATVVSMSTGASIAAPGTMNMSLYHIIPRNYTGITDKNTVRTCRPLKICLLSGVCRALASCCWLSPQGHHTPLTGCTMHTHTALTGCTMHTHTGAVVAYMHVAIRPLPATLSATLTFSALTTDLLVPG